MEPIVKLNSATIAEVEEEADWEEWDGRSPFWIHCVAGSLAGVTEVCIFFVVRCLYSYFIWKVTFLL
jgi:hypothetical protein